MSNSHGDLFTEIGKLVLAVNMGEPIDLDATAKDLATRYQNLGISEETYAKIVSRSIGAVRLSLVGAGPRAKLPDPPAPAAEGTPGSSDGGASGPPKAFSTAAQPNGARRGTGRAPTKAAAKGEGSAPAKSLFPSGVRLAVLS
jgi:hypothetical protein